MQSKALTKEAAEEILGLPPRYSKVELRRAYTDQARRFHPDAAKSQHLDARIAQERMVRVNQAYDVLKLQFFEMPERVVERGSGGIARGYAEVDWRADEADAQSDPWAFAQDWDSTPVPEPVPLSVRSVLLGPVVPRVAVLCAAAWLWWRYFPLLFGNLDAYLPAGSWTLFGVARLVSGMVYPSYFLIYELLSGYVSELARELANGLVTFACRHYVDLRRNTASYGCALYKLLRNQVYALLMAPGVLYLAAVATHETNHPVVRALCAAAALLLGVDALAACVHGGFVNVWSYALAERVEAAYLLARARLLRRCGQWMSA